MTLAWLAGGRRAARLALLHRRRRPTHLHPPVTRQCFSGRRGCRPAKPERKRLP